MHSSVELLLGLAGIMSMLQQTRRQTDEKRSKNIRK
jgi:hypothetical protein